MMSRSHAHSGDRKLSQITLKDPDGIEAALRSVYSEENSWFVPLIPCWRNACVSGQ